MAKYLSNIVVTIKADGGDDVQSVTAGFVVKDDVDSTYLRSGSFIITSFIPIYHEAIRRIVEEAQDQICISEGLSCSSSSSPSSVL